MIARSTAKIASKRCRTWAGWEPHCATQAELHIEPEDFYSLDPLHPTRTAEGTCKDGSEVTLSPRVFGARWGSSRSSGHPPCSPWSRLSAMLAAPSMTRLALLRACGTFRQPPMASNLTGQPYVKGVITKPRPTKQICAMVCFQSRSFVLVAL